MSDKLLPRFPEISSPSNPRIKRLTALQTRAKSRRGEGVFILEGLRLFMDAPPELLQEVYVTEGFLQKAEPVVHEHLSRLSGHAELILLPERLMDKITQTETPQGILCTAAMPPELQMPVTGDHGGQIPLYLLLEDIQDPGNLGTIFRTAEAAGASGIIMSRETTDIFSPKAVRATMSSIFRVPFLYTEDLPGAVRSMTAAGYLTCAAHLEGSVSYTEPDYRGPAAILIGNEGRGLREETASAAKIRIRIPMEGSIDSLNAAMAAGILLYEVHRQRTAGIP